MTSPQRQPARPPDAQSIFTITSAMDAVLQGNALPIPKQLIGPLMYEGDLVIGFGGTGVAKTVFGVQASELIAIGQHFPGLATEAPTPQNVLYVDFELSPQQFAMRYTDPTGKAYQFSPRFTRATMTPDTAPDDLPRVIAQQLEDAVNTTSAKVLVIDNISYIADQLEDTKFAASLVKKLRSLKNRLGISILVWAHTPKRDETQPITINDLAGSKTLSNLADSIFAIGKTADDARYVKHLKVRIGELTLNESNVALFKLEKRHDFLQLVHQGYGQERELLRICKFDTAEEALERAKELRATGLSFRRIAAEIGLDHMTVKRRLNAAGIE